MAVNDTHAWVLLQRFDAWDSNASTCTILRSAKNDGNKWETIASFRESMPIAAASFSASDHGLYFVGGAKKFNKGNASSSGKLFHLSWNDLGLAEPQAMRRIYADPLPTPNTWTISPNHGTMTQTADAIVFNELQPTQDYTLQAITSGAN